MSQNRARARAQRSGTRNRIERQESLVFDYEHEHRRKRLSTSTEIATYFTIAHGYLVIQRYVLAVLLIPVGFVAAVSFSELPRARLWLQPQHIRSGKASVPELIRLLAHEDRYVRICAARSLMNMGSNAKDAVPALNEALNDEDESVRRYVRRALERLEPRHTEFERSFIVPKDNETTPSTLSPSWTTQSPYAGDPRNRPRGTVCLRFADG